MRNLSRSGIGIAAALLIAGASNAAPNQSKDIIVLANRWLGMSMDQFKQAVGVTPGATEMKSTDLAGKPVTELADAAAPGLRDLEPAELAVFSYTFDASGHLTEMGGFVKQGVTDDEAAKIVTADYGPPIEGNVTLGMREHLWAVNDVALEISAGAVFIFRIPQRCLDAYKSATPDPKALEGCGRP